MSTLDISEFAITLLKVAYENDHSNSLFANKALEKSLEVLASLHIISQLPEDNERLNQIEQLIGEKLRENNFLNLVASLIRKIDLDLLEEANQSANHESETKYQTDFDQLVFQALGQTLSEIIWQPDQNNLNDGVGPELLDCLDFFESQEKQVIWTVFVKNYLANVMVHIFASAKELHRRTQQYPDQIAEALRTYDATILALYVFEDWKVEENEKFLLTQLSGISDAINQKDYKK